MKFLPASLVEDRRALAALAIAVAGLVLASTMLGRYPLSLATVMDVLTGAVTGKSAAPDTAQIVVLTVRLPRVVTAVMIGAGLAMSGAAYQSLFRNPIASPDLLGVSAGAGFGASLAILLRQPLLAVQTASFCGGLAAVLIALLANRMTGGRSVVTLVLCGMVLAALFQALISIVKYVADPIEALAAITFWLMGSLARVDATGAITVSVPVLMCGFLLYLNRWRISLLGLGEQEAAALGVDIRRTKILVIACATLMSAATVSVAGIVGWVGLLIPHVARMLFGMEPCRLLIATALLGAGFLLAVDDLARSLAVLEVPIGILTAIIGAPFFLILLMRSGREYWA